MANTAAAEFSSSHHTPSSPAESGRPSYSSTSEKIETLIHKYRSGRRQYGSERQDTTSTYTGELQAWSSVSRELQQRGLEPVSFTTSDGTGDMVLDEAGSCSLRHTVLSLLEELQRKDAVLSELTATTTTATTGDFSVADGESDGVMMKLREQITQLQYTNARLKVELMNRPLARELQRCQRKLKEMENYQQKYRNVVSSEQLDLINAQNELKNVRAAVGVVGNTDKAVTAVAELRERSDRLATVEQYLVSVARTVLGTTSSHPPPVPGSASLLCPQLWSTVCDTLGQWRDDLAGLRELSSMVGELCHTPAAAGRHMGHSYHISCRKMAELVRGWMRKGDHRKIARSSVLADIVTHFQHLFDVPTLDGVYPRMSVLYQQLHESKAALHNLHSILGVDVHSSWQKVVSCVEVLAEQENNALIMSIQQQFGPLTNEQVLQQLSLYQEFFPTFKHLVSEIQEFLGVQSLTAVMPALKQLALS